MEDFEVSFVEFRWTTD